MYIYTYIYTYKSVHIYICVCIYIYIYIYINWESVPVWICPDSGFRDSAKPLSWVCQRPPPSAHVCPAPAPLSSAVWSAHTPPVAPRICMWRHSFTWCDSFMWFDACLWSHSYIGITHIRDMNRICDVTHSCCVVECHASSRVVCCSVVHVQCSVLQCVAVWCSAV